MNAAVLEEHFKRLASYLTTNWVKAAEHYVAGGIIDHNIDARGLLERLYIAPFFADDPAFHFLIFELHACERTFRCNFAAHAFHSGHNEYCRLVFGRVFGFILKLGNQPSQIIFNIALGHLHELFSCICFAEFGDFL